MAINNMTHPNRLTQLKSDILARYTPGQIRAGFVRRDPTINAELREVGYLVRPGLPDWTSEFVGYETVLDIVVERD